jgi:hypothetical protein
MVHFHWSERHGRISPASLVRLHFIYRSVEELALSLSPYLVRSAFHDSKLIHPLGR